jgi:hypothetical protein
MSISSLVLSYLLVLSLGLMAGAMFEEWLARKDSLWAGSAIGFVLFVVLLIVILTRTVTAWAE